MRSLWTDPEQAGYPSLAHNLKVDIAIIGGGLAGVGAAHALHATDLRVALLETRTLAAGASGRNAGFVLAGPAMPLDQAVALVGEEEAQAIWDLTIRNNATIAGLIDMYRIECGFLRRGSMTLAASAQEWRQLGMTYASLSRHSVGAYLVPPEGLPRPFDTLYHGGLYYAGNGELDPARFVKGVAQAIAGRVSIFEHTAVQSWQYDGSWHILTPGGTVVADQVLVTTNAYSGQLVPGVPIVPVRGQVLATQPIDREVIPFPMYADDGYQYFRQTSEGRLVVGGWRNLDVDGEQGVGETLHPGIQATLEDFAAGLLGESPEIDYRWAGIMGFTPDHLPLVGRVPGQEGLWIAAGYSGHGVSMAFQCGAAIAHAAGDQVDQSVSAPRSFDPSRFASLS